MIPFTHRKNFLFLLILAFALKSLFSVGFMPVANADTFLEIEICTSNGLSKVLHKQDNPTSDDEPHDSECPFTPTLSKTYLVETVQIEELFYSFKYSSSLEFKSLELSVSAKTWDATAPPNLV